MYCFLLFSLLPFYQLQTYCGYTKSDYVYAVLVLLCYLSGSTFTISNGSEYDVSYVLTWYLGYVVV
jgi:hypothetical protein